MTATAFAAPAPAETIIPTAYAVRLTITTCSCCGTQSRSSEFLAVSYLKSRAGIHPVKHWTTCDRPEYNLPIERVFAPARRVPYCADCADVELSHLPFPPSAAGLYDLAEPTLKGVKTASKPVAPKAQRPKIEDLA
jgi:hypothetical protein